MTRDELIALPKIELHCHLDGSLSKKFLERKLGKELKKEQLCVSDDCDSLAEYLEKFSLPGLCIQDEQGLEEAAYDVLKHMNRENVCYAEIRFAPLLSVSDSISCDRVIEAVIHGLERGKDTFGVEYGLITCAMRHHSAEENLAMIKTARKYLGEGVCAADLAGAEASYPMSEFMELFRETKKMEMPFTIHAGECGNVKNIIDAVEAGASRIGHGIAMKGHRELERELSDKKIGIELCPISNLQTKAVSGTDEYPIREFIDAGLAVSVNTDNRTVSDTTLSREFEFVQKTYGIKDNEIKGLMMNAVETAFASDDTKDRLLRKINAAYKM